MHCIHKLLTYIIFFSKSQPRVYSTENIVKIPSGFFFRDFFLAILLSSSIHPSDKNFGIMTFLSSCLIVCWFAALIVAVIGSVGLIVFCYREESHEAYVVVLLPMRFLFVMFSILSPVSFTLVGASTGAVCFAFLYPFLTASLILYVILRDCRRPNGEYFVIKNGLL